MSLGYFELLVAKQGLREVGYDEGCGLAFLLFAVIVLNGSVCPAFLGLHIRLEELQDHIIMHTIINHGIFLFLLPHNGRSIPPVDCPKSRPASSPGSR